MHTRRALDSLFHAVRALPRHAGLPQVSDTDKVLKAIGALGAPPALPAGNQLEEVRHRLLEALSSEGGIATAAPKDLQQSVWLLWSGEKPLAQLSEVFSAALTEARRRKRGRILRNLIEAWIAHFAPSKPRVAEAGDAIRQMLEESDDPRLTVWREASRRYRFFDAAQGPTAIAREIVRGDEPLPQILECTGLDEPMRAVSGYAHAVLHALVALAPDALRGAGNLTALHRIADFAAPLGQLRFEESQERARLAVGLMRPWLDGGKPPNDEVAASLQKYLLEWLGDPRRSTKWQAAGERATALMLKWLAKKSIKVFFDMIADHSNKESFTYRRAFWEAYIHANLVDEVWLALGSKIYHDARTHRALDGNYGKLEGANVQSNHAIFLIKIQDLIFCEWSHDGKVRAWKATARKAPSLGKPLYDRLDVVEPGLPFPRNTKGSGGSTGGDGLSHSNSRDGYWQSSVAELLARNTRVRLTAKDWMPK
jgi:hypothetical protein